MADAATLTRVDLEHRRQQAELAQRIARLIQGYWLTVDPTDLSGTGAPWLRQSVEAITAGRRNSALLASAYAETIHQLQVPRSPRLEIPELPDVSPEQLYRSLSFTGLGYAVVNLAKTPEATPPQPGAVEEDVQRAERELQSRDEMVAAVMDQAITNASKAAVKHVVNGARDLTDALVVTKTALGYYRVTQSENPCGFCLALASRGPVYEDDSFEESDERFTGPGKHKVHDGCMCTLRPVFTRSEDEWGDQARAADSLWRTHGVARDGRSAMENFRRQAKLLGIADANRW